jgi:DNA repair protein RecO (recombination protein O)
MRQRDQAICLRTRDYSETSQVVVFLTRDAGVVHVMAKGTKRPKSKSGGAIDLLSEGELVYTSSRSGGLGTLVEFAEAVTRRELRSDAARLNAGMYVVEATGQMLATEDPHTEVFDLLHNALERLKHPDAPIAAVVAYFLWRLTHHVGLLGQLDDCVACGVEMGDQAKRRWFSSAMGGLLCNDCAAQASERVPLSPQTQQALTALAMAAEGRRVSLPDGPALSAAKLLNYHVTHQLGKPLRMARHVLGTPARG